MPFEHFLIENVFIIIIVEHFGTGFPSDMGEKFRKNLIKFSLNFYFLPNVY